MKEQTSLLEATPTTQETGRLPNAELSLSLPDLPKASCETSNRSATSALKRADGSSRRREDRHIHLVTSAQKTHADQKTLTCTQSTACINNEMPAGRDCHRRKCTKKNSSREFHVHCVDRAISNCSLVQIPTEQRGKHTVLLEIKVPVGMCTPSNALKAMCVSVCVTDSLTQQHSRDVVGGCSVLSSIIQVRHPQNDPFVCLGAPSSSRHGEPVELPTELSNKPSFLATHPCREQRPDAKNRRSAIGNRHCAVLLENEHQSHSRD